MMEMKQLKELRADLNKERIREEEDRKEEIEKTKDKIRKEYQGKEWCNSKVEGGKNYFAMTRQEITRIYGKISNGKKGMIWGFARNLECGRKLYLQLNHLLS